MRKSSVHTCGFARTRACAHTPGGKSLLPLGWALCRDLLPLGPPGCGRPSATSFPPPPAPLTLGLPALTPTFALGCEAFPQQARARTHTLAQHRAWSSGTDDCGMSSVALAFPRVPLAPPTAPSCGPALTPRHPAAYFSGTQWAAPADQLRPAHTTQEAAPTEPSTHTQPRGNLWPQAAAAGVPCSHTPCSKA